MIIYVLISRIIDALDFIIDHGVHSPADLVLLRNIKQSWALSDNLSEMGKTVPFNFRGHHGLSLEDQVLFKLTFAVHEGCQ